MLAILTCIVLVKEPVKAASFQATVNGITWKCYVYSDDTISIGVVNRQSTLQNFTSLSIPSQINGHQVTCLDTCFAASCDTLQSITIPEGVYRISSSAFYNCKSLVSINIPSSVNYIDDTAFQGCESLQYITIPANVRSIGDCAFEGCAKLRSIDVQSGNQYYSSWSGVLCNKDATVLLTYPQGRGSSYSVPSGIKTIGKNAFSGCTSLQSVSIPGSVTNIDDFAFKNCKNLTTVNISYGVSRMGEEIFNNCTSLYSINIPDSVQSIGLWAFAYCSRLTSINIPSSVNSMNGSVFNCCRNLSSITVDEGNNTYTSVDGVVFSKDKKTLVVYPSGKGTSYTIPSYVTRIGDYGLSGNYLTSIRIPSNVKVIGNNAFHWCVDLASVDIVEGVTTIEDSAFSCCMSLTSIRIPDGVTTIGNEAFYQCSKLTSVVIPSSVADIDSYAFSYCSALGSGTVYYLGTKQQWQSLLEKKNNFIWYFSSAQYQYYLKPSVVKQPEGTTITEGTTGTKISVAGTSGVDKNGSSVGTLSYQWFENTTNNTSTGTLINGATSSSYEVPSDKVGSKYYYCRITNTLDSVSCSVVSNTAMITTEAFVIPGMSGSGSISDPYIISDPSHLLDVPNDLGACYQLAIDIDLLDAEWTPIGTAEHPFTGTFMGNGHTISNFQIYGDDNVGFFGVIDGATISGLTLDYGFSAGTSGVGVLIGKTQGNKSLMEYCNVTNGTIRGESCIGGLLGMCNSGASVKIQDCHVDAYIAGGDKIGGLAGQLSGEVKRCYFTGYVGSYGNEVGGLIGEANDSNITTSYFNGDITGSYNVGGLVGLANSGRITDCYAIGSIEVTDGAAGGLLGNETGSTQGQTVTIQNCYAATTFADGGTCHGLFESGAQAKSCYYDMTISKLNKGSESIKYGRFTYEMKRKTTFLGWDFTSVWAIDNGKSYPTLQEGAESAEIVEEFSVSFESNCGFEVPVQSVVSGECVMQPSTVENAGYVLEGWYTDEECTCLYDFSSPVTSDFTLYAKWQLDYSELKAVVDDANAKINSGLYKTDTMEFSIYRNRIKSGERMLNDKSAVSADDITSAIDRIREAEQGLELK